MDLIIVESPTKAKTLARFLGDGYSIEATKGHIKDLPKSKLGVDVENNFKPDYQEVEKARDNVKSILKSAKKAKHVYLATDPDREGEAIAEHVKEILTDKPLSIKASDIDRIVFHEITKNAVEEAIKIPRKVDRNLVDAQIARRVLDRLVGYNLSPLLWRKVRRGLSAGRVQSVAVRLIVEKEKEIEKFKPIEYWEIFVDLKTLKSKTLRVALQKINNKKAEVGNKKVAGEVVDNLNKSDYRVLDIVKKEVRKNPYPPFTTSTLAQAGARIFGWSAKRTMSVAQKLYEEGLITYHRTDSTNIAAEALTKTRSYIEKNFGNEYLPGEPKFYKTSQKVAQEAHEAIRPTNLETKFETESEKFVHDMEKLYKLIWGRFVACQMEASVYDETAIDVEAKSRHPEQASRSEGSYHYLLRASGQIMKFDGWRKVIPAKISEDAVTMLPDVEKDEELKFVKLDSLQKFTQPPARFNEASLIKTLEKLGIGRPSTYAPIITTIQIRQYVEKNEGKFNPTPVGIAVNDFLITNFPEEIEYSFTAKMEDSLDEVANGKLEWTSQIGTFWKPFSKKIKSVEKNSKRVKIEAEKLGKKCPECKKGELVIRTGRFGKFISCSTFPDCKFTDKYMEKIHMKCPKCGSGDVVVKKTKKGRTFFGCSKYPECDFASWTKPTRAKPEDTKEEAKKE